VPSLKNTASIPPETLLTQYFAILRTVWPDDQPTPWFRSSVENSKKLQEITKQLAEDESYSFTKAGLGIKAIEEIVRKFMHERRQKENDPLSSHSDQDSGRSGAGSPFFTNSPARESSKL